MEQAGRESLPIIKTGKSSKVTMPGWNEHIKPYSDEAKFWHQLWLSAGRPLFGDIFINMKFSKKQFKFAIRRLKRCREKIQNEKFLTSLLENNGNFYDEIRKNERQNS